MELDRCAERYGCRPSELLRSDTLDLAIDLACAAQADATRADLMARLGMVFPVVRVG